jgi:hypothetical protein
MSVLSSSSSTNKPKNNGTGVVRIKPMGAGGGGGETSASTGHSSVEHCANTNSVRIGTKQGNKGYNFAAVIQPETDNAAMFEQFMPPRIEGFPEG